MHAGTIVTQVLARCLEGVHAKRAAACHRAVLAVVRGALLSLSGVALKVRAATAYRHRVKSIDRLLGNAALHARRGSVYAALAASWLSGVEQVLLVIDWSDLTADQKWHWLRASVVVEGRSVTLYEEVHAQRRLGNPKVQREFLKRVAELLPTGCTPIVMTDAGFHAAWFKAVEYQGWSFIGRIRGRELVKRDDAQPWIRATSLYAQAREQPRSLGLHSFVRSNPLPVRLVLVRQRAKGRHRLNIYGQRRRSRTNAKCARAAKDPWLVAASPRLDHLSAAAIVKLYAQRMRIEQSFRDTKNVTLGQGLQITRSRTRERLQTLLLIGHLAAFVQRLIGEAAKAHQLELEFMASARKNRPEISVLTLARRIVSCDRAAQYLDRLSPWAAIPPLRAQAIQACAVA